MNTQNKLNFNYDKDKTLKERYFDVICYTPNNLLVPVLKIYDHYAFITHDKDINEDGTPKEPHKHVLIYTKNQTTFQAVCNRIHDIDKQNVRIKPVLDKRLAYQYLTHKNDPTKYQYNDDDICTDNKVFWAGKEEDTLLDDLLGGVTLREMFHKYGRDFAKNYERYRQFAQMVYMQENPQPIRTCDRGLIPPDESRDDVPPDDLSTIFDDKQLKIL